MTRLVKTISVYSFGSVATAGISFFLLPLYTRFLTPADYGTLELLYAGISILGVLYGLRISNSYGRFYFQSDDPEYRRTLFATGQLFHVFSAAVLGGAFVWNAEWLAHKWLPVSDGAYYLRLAAVAAFGEVLALIPLNNLRVRFKPVAYVAVSLSNLAATIAVTACALAVTDLGVAGALYGRIAGQAVSLVALLAITWRELHWKISFGPLGGMLAYSIFIIPVDLSGILLTTSNRFFLQHFRTLQELGLFALGNRFAAVVAILITEPVMKAFIPHVFELSADVVRCRATLARFTQCFVVGVSTVVLALSLSADSAIDLLGTTAYGGSGQIVFVLATSNLLIGLSTVFAIAIHISKRTWIISLIWVLASTANLGFNRLLIPRYGGDGAAYASALSAALLCVMYAYAAKRVLDFRVPYREVALALGGLLVFNYTGSLIPRTSCWLNVARLVVAALYGVVLTAWLGLASRNDVRRVLQSIRRTANATRVQEVSTS
jgi:O-antigen/teichoic acid export membrane protein